MKTGLYKHYKGGIYRVFGISKDTDTGEPKIFYRCETTGKLYHRSPEEWHRPTIDGKPRYVRLYDSEKIRNALIKEAADINDWGPIFQHYVTSSPEFRENMQRYAEAVVAAMEEADGPYPAGEVS